VRRRLRRLGCIVALVLWFAILMLPCIGFYLAVRGEITWDRSRFSYDRLWLVREERQTGIALAHTQPIGPTDVDEVCTRTFVTIWLWSEGSFERTGYCDCERRTETGDWTMSRECTLP
jgi:hypothetical protein